MELYFHIPICLDGVVLSEAQGQLYLYRNRAADTPGTAETTVIYRKHLTQLEALTGCEFTAAVSRQGFLPNRCTKGFLNLPLSNPQITDGTSKFHSRHKQTWSPVHVRASRDQDSDFILTNLIRLGLTNFDDE
jgi:hypothetical protein